jgi:hypothetical protein
MLIAVILCGMGVFWLILLAITQRNSARLLSAKIVIGHCHWILGISCIAVGWKSELSLFLAANEVVMSLGVSIIPGRCFLSGFSWVFLRAAIASSLPIVSFAISALIFLLLHLFKKRKIALSDLSTTATLLIFLLHPYVTKSIAALLRCRHMQGAAYWLYEDMAEECWTGTHERMLIGYLLPVGILYFVAIPGSMLFYIRKNRENPLFVRELYWDFCVFVCKTVLILVLSSANNLESKIQVLICVFSLYIPIYPAYPLLLHKRMAVLSQGAALILAISAFFLVDSAGVSLQGRTRLGVTMVCFEAIVLAVLVYLMLRGHMEGAEVVPLPLEYGDGGEGMCRVPGNSMSEEYMGKRPDSPSFSMPLQS